VNFDSEEEFRWTITNQERIDSLHEQDTARRAVRGLPPEEPYAFGRCLYREQRRREIRTLRQLADPFVPKRPVAPRPWWRVVMASGTAWRRPRERRTRATSAARAGPSTGSADPPPGSRQPGGGRDARTPCRGAS